MKTNIINIADYLPRYSAEDLQAEARENTISPDDKMPTDQFFLDLPNMLTDATNYIMSEFDYQRSKGTSTAIGLRCLAALTITIDAHLMEMREY